MGRGEFLGLAGLGAIAATVGSANVASAQVEEYYGRARPPAGMGLGRGEAASLSVVWMPKEEGGQLPPLDVRLALFDLGGKILAEQKASLAPFTGASVEFALPRGMRRLSVFGYAFIHERVDEIFGAFEVFSVASGRSKVAAPGVIA
jgi:hypothetical protein